LCRNRLTRCRDRAASDLTNRVRGSCPPPDPDEPADTGAFVARLRYQQTKVDGIVPTILAEQAIVDIITDQQRWLAAKYPGLQPRYLFLGLKRTSSAVNGPAPTRPYRAKLEKLDKTHNLTDSAGRPLRFTQTHRLRHTRATELQRRCPVPRRAAISRPRVRR
jgi:hypothetical protein